MNGLCSTPSPPSSFFLDNSERVSGSTVIDFTGERGYASPHPFSLLFPFLHASGGLNLVFVAYALKYFYLNVKAKSFTLCEGRDGSDVFHLSPLINFKRSHC